MKARSNGNTNTCNGDNCQSRFENILYLSITGYPGVYSALSKQDTGVGGFMFSLASFTKLSSGRSDPASIMGANFQRASNILLQFPA